MRKSSKDIRTYASVHGIWLWRVAERVGLSDYRLSRLMRRELSPRLQGEAFRGHRSISNGGFGKLLKIRRN